MYDDANRMTSQTWRFGTGLYHQQYSYTGVKADGATDGSVDGTISAITTTIPGRSAITSKYEYNDLRQLEKKMVTVTQLEKLLDYKNDEKVLKQLLEIGRASCRERV